MKTSDTDTVAGRPGTLITNRLVTTVSSASNSAGNGSQVRTSITARNNTIAPTQPTTATNTSSRGGSAAVSSPSTVCAIGYRCPTVGTLVSIQCVRLSR